jgi:hypothetical protein
MGNFLSFEEEDHSQHEQKQTTILTEEPEIKNIKKRKQKTKRRKIIKNKTRTRIQDDFIDDNNDNYE